jgi:hypothetical protein
LRVQVEKWDMERNPGSKAIDLMLCAGAPAGEVKNIQVVTKRGTSGSGDVTYEIAIPSLRLAPFKPGVGNAHTKDIDTVGDLILEDVR